MGVVRGAQRRINGNIRLLEDMAHGEKTHGVLSICRLGTSTYWRKWTWLRLDGEARNRAPDLRTFELV